MAAPLAITEGAIAFLRGDPSARRTHGTAELRVEGDLYTMRGPSGTHTLLIVATDLDRLNAHWAGFCADARNQGDA